MPVVIVWSTLLFLLVACQLPFQSLEQQPSYILPVANERPLPLVAAMHKSPPYGQLQRDHQRIKLRVQFPPLWVHGFQTQKLDTVAAYKISARLNDSFDKTYQPVGADGNGFIDYPVDGVVHLTFENVLPDALLLAELKVLDNTLTEIPQAEVAVALRHTGVANPAAQTINFQTGAVAKTLKALLALDANRARTVDISQLITLIGSITGQGGSAPNFTYSQVHPTLVKIPELAAALVASNPNVLTASNYRATGATVNLTVSGLVGADKLQVQITDAASAIKTNLGNGSGGAGFAITKATPGSGLNVKVSAFGSPSIGYTYSASPATLTLTEGAAQTVTINAVPNMTVTGFSPTSGPIGTSVVITGTGFTGATQVTFNGVAAAFEVNNNTQITATVPATASDGTIVVSNAGTATSPTSFDVNRVIYAKANASSSENGSSWNNATTLQQALTLASANDDIWIAAGTYTPGTLANQTFQMKPNVDLYGGFAGTESLFSERNPALHQVVLSGDLEGNDTGSDASYTVVGTNSNNVVKGANNATLEGVTVRAGNSSVNGGGMNNTNVSPTLNQVIFEYNRSTVEGGALSLLNTSSVLNQVTFRYNRMTGTAGNLAGGALHISSGSPVLNNCIFMDNQSSRNGGALGISGASVTFNVPQFINNTAALAGGGLYTIGGTVILNQAHFSGNTAGEHGGISNVGGTVTVNQSLFSSNTATNRGSAIGIREGGTFNVSDSVFQQNTVTNGNSTVYVSGPGTQINLTRVLFYSNSVSTSASTLLAAFGSLANLNNVVFANNAAAAGPTMTVNASTATLQNVTFANNLGSDAISSNSSTLSLSNVLLWNNSTSLTLDAGQGNFIASSDPFINAADPLGPDGLGLTEDDGLRVNSSVLNSGMGAGAPEQDILKRDRIETPESGAYEYYP